MPGASIGPPFASMPAEDVARIKTRVRARCKTRQRCRISYAASANAIRGRVPA